jgi:1-acyl-sn-glycerol-3-phosphate acyltransferase
MRNVLAGLVLAVLTLPGLLVLLAAALIRRPELFLSYGTWVMRVGRVLLGIEVEAEGLGRFDRMTPYVFMSNHLSFLDAPALVTVIDRPLRFIVKRFVLRIPVFGWGMRLAGYVPLDREGVGEGRKRLARAADLIRTRGYSFLIYPEGQRSWDGRLQRFRRGGFFLAVEAGVPIVPVSIDGTFELMPRVSWKIRPGRVRVIFHEPVPVAGVTPASLPELMERVRAAIAAGLTS